MSQETLGTLIGHLLGMPPRVVSVARRPAHICASWVGEPDPYGLSRGGPAPQIPPRGMGGQRLIAAARRGAMLAVLLFFSLSPVVAGCGAGPPPVQPEPSQSANLPDFPSQSGGPCGRLSSYERGETFSHVVHGQDVDYTLTDRSLYIWRLVGEFDSAQGGEVAVKADCSRLDMRSVLQRGLVDWEIGNDTSYFLTKDQHLIVLPHGETGGSLTTYKLDFETASLSKKRMIYHAGMIFMAPLREGVTVLSFLPEFRSAIVAVDARNPQAGFAQRNDRLYFGIEGGVEVELVIEGSTASSVSAVDER